MVESHLLLSPLEHSRSTTTRIYCPGRAHPGDLRSRIWPRSGMPDAWVSNTGSEPTVRHCEPDEQFLEGNLVSRLGCVRKCAHDTTVGSVSAAEALCHDRGGPLCFDAVVCILCLDCQEPGFGLAGGHGG